MPSMEEVARHNKTLEQKKQIITNVTKDYNALEQKMESAQTQIYKDYLNFKLKQKKDYLSKIYTPYSTEQKNIKVIKSIYNTLLRKKGVCEEYTYSYEFLLQGLGIRSYYITVYKDKAQYAHAINLVEIMEEGKLVLYVADLTKGVMTRANKENLIWAW